MGDVVDEIWPAIRAAFASYGVTTRKKLSQGRRNILQRHLDDGIELKELPSAVHGYLWQHKGPDTQFSNGDRSGDYLRFETVYKLGGMELRVELGAQGRWIKVDPKAFHDQQVKAKQKAAQERVAAARLRLVQGGVGDGSPKQID